MNENTYGDNGGKKYKIGKVQNWNKKLKPISLAMLIIEENKK